jgi:hypothetical protein
MLYLKFFIACAFSVVVGIVHAQGVINDKEPFTIGLKAGVGQNTNAYRMSSDNSDYNCYGLKPMKSYGMDLGLGVTQRLRPRVELNLIQYQYGMEWFNGSTFDNTVCTLNNLDLNLYLDYRLLKTGKMTLFISPGVVNEFVTNTSFETTFTDGSTSDAKYNSFQDDHRDQMMGAALSVLGKYNITPWLGVTVNAGYTNFFNGFDGDNTKNYQRFSINGGLELKLF